MLNYTNSSSMTVMTVLRQSNIKLLDAHNVVWVKRFQSKRITLNLPFIVVICFISMYQNLE